MIAARYAKALLQYANQQQAAATVYDEAERLSRKLMLDEAFRAAVYNPLLPDNQKLGIMTEALDGNMSAVMQRFLQLVLQHKRAKYLPFIWHTYLDKYCEQQQIRKAEITTAVPVTGEMQQRICRQVEQRFGGIAQVHNKVDADIEGGFIFQIDSVRLDASVRTQIRRIRQQFLDKNRRIV